MYLKYKKIVFHSLDLNPPGHVDNLREVNKELLERIKVNVQDDIDKQTGKCLVLLWVQNNFESVQIGLDLFKIDFQFTVKLGVLKRLV